MNTEKANQNRQAVKEMYESFQKGDIPSIVGRLADDCIWKVSGEGFIPSGGTYKGKDAMRFFSILAETEEFNSFNVKSIHSISENEVIVFGDVDATVKSTGKRASTDWIMYWKMNDEGNVVFFQDFYDTAILYNAFS